MTTWHTEAASYCRQPFSFIWYCFSSVLYSTVNIGLSTIIYSTLSLSLITPERAALGVSTHAHHSPYALALNRCREKLVPVLRVGPFCVHWQRIDPFLLLLYRTPFSSVWLGIYLRVHAPFFNGKFLGTINGICIIFLLSPTGLELELYSSHTRSCG